MPTVFITGVSSGIGESLAKFYLKNDWTVLGMSRREPESLLEHESFQFRSLDLNKPEQIADGIQQLLDGLRDLDLAVLNAGRLGVFGDLANAELGDLKETMQVNVWANKLILDALFSLEIPIRQVVLISSGASVNGNRGWSGYSISKAALNMLTKLYAAEQPETHFCALAPGVVDTAIQDELLEREPDERFPAVENLRALRGTEKMPEPDDSAPRLAEDMARLPNLVTSGDYADIRSPPLA